MDRTKEHNNDKRNETYGFDNQIDKIQAVIKSWLQHAGDRLPKEGTKKK